MVDRIREAARLVWLVTLLSMLPGVTPVHAEDERDAAFPWCNRDRAMSQLEAFLVWLGKRRVGWWAALLGMLLALPSVFLAMTAIRM